MLLRCESLEPPMSQLGPKGDIAAAFGDVRSTPLTGRRAFMSTRPSVMGPMMSSLPSERRAAELMLLSVVNAWPPHHAVRGSGEPI